MAQWFMEQTNLKEMYEYWEQWQILDGVLHQQAHFWELHRITKECDIKSCSFYVPMYYCTYYCPFTFFAGIPVCEWTLSLLTNKDSFITAQESCTPRAYTNGIFSAILYDGQASVMQQLHQTSHPDNQRRLAAQGGPNCVSLVGCFWIPLWSPPWNGPCSRRRYTPIERETTRSMFTAISCCS